MKTPNRYYELQNQLPQLTGTAKQIKWATDIRAKHFHQLWEEGFHGTDESFIADCAKLPADAKWWIEASQAAHPATNIHIKILQILELWYQTPAGSDY